MFTLWSDMDRLFNSSFADWMFNNTMPRMNNHSYSSALRMNLIDRGNSLRFIAELPGVDEKDINLSVHEDTLTLSAKREITHDEDDTVYLSERSDYDIQRSIALPARIVADDITASLKNGVLTVDLPKAPESKPQQIAINA